MLVSASSFTEVCDDTVSVAQRLYYHTVRVVRQQCKDYVMALKYQDYKQLSVDHIIPTVG